MEKILLEAYMCSIKDLKNTIVLENDFVKIELSKKDAEVLSVVRLDTRENILSKKEKSYFFSLHTASDKVTSEEYDFNDFIKHYDEPCDILGLELEGEVITIKCEYQTLRVKVGVFDRYFTYEILDDMKEPLARIVFADARFEYEGDFATVSVSMTVNGVVPTIPRATERHPRGIVHRTSGNSKGAKIGEVLAPFSLHNEILKELCSTIDPEKGIVLRTSGPWTRDYALNYTNYKIAIGFKQEFLEKADEYLAMGVDQFDFHEGPWAFWQGNFKCTELRDMTEFREKLCVPLRKKGITCGLHIYSHYIDEHCHDLLSDPKWQKDLLLGEEYTLAKDISDTDDIIEVLEDIEELSTDYSFFSLSLPFMLIGNEIVRIVKDHGRFTGCERGACGTRAVAHKKGEKVRHCTGKFHMFSPIPGSELFLEVARNTAKAYNEGGFTLIYIDAIDGLYSLDIDQPYYAALFVHEIVKNCKSEPTIEYAAPSGSLWCAMGRTGAWDAACQAYRGFNRYHVVKNIEDADNAHLLGMMGWYNLFRAVDAPSNYSTKYQHFDDAEYIGSLSLIYGYTMVFRDSLPDGRFPALKRNVDIFAKYHNLKRQGYFSQEYLEKLRDLDREFHVKAKGKNKWGFEEKKYAFKRLFDIADKTRNTAEFTNPFKKQKPFVRLEAGLSTLGEDKILLLPMDESKQIPEKFTYTFARELDATNHNALTFRVHGNGKKGSAVRVCFECKMTRGAARYIVDTDFEGWREFTFVESDSGERPDLPFDSRDGHFYNTYFHGVKPFAMTGVTVETAGDCEGVRIGNIYGSRIAHEITKNPTIRVGKSEVKFECELASSDFIEFDGKSAKVLDRWGNSKDIWFEGELVVPKGEFKAEVFGTSLNGGVINQKLTFIFTGDEIK